MTRYVLAALLMLLCLTQAISAQTPTPEPAPWPPDPNTIFAEGVQWSIFDEDQDKSLIIEHEQGVIRVKDAATKMWRDYAFPEGKEIHKATMQPDGRIRVSWSYEDTDSPDSTRLLNPGTGLYERPDTLCEGKVLQVPDDQGQWVVLYHEGNYGDHFLCHSSTGEQREDLPTGFMNWYVLETRDDNRLIMAMGGTSTYQVFVYHLSDSSLLLLGTVDNAYESDLSVCDWLTDTRGLLCSKDRQHDYLPTDYYEFDITQPDSLKEVFYAWQDNLFTLKNPKRYFVIEDQMFNGLKVGGLSGNEPFQPCKLLIYDATGLREHVLGNRCIPEIDYVTDQTPSYSFFGGLHFYYLIKETDWATSATLYQYDIQQDMASEPLFTEDIDRILASSPDDRYIVLILNGDGMFGCCIAPQQVGILDTQTWDIVYRSEPMGIYAADQIIWLDDQTLVIVASAAIENMGASSEDGKWVTRVVPATLRRIHLQDEKAVPVEITTDYTFSVSFDVFNVGSHYWLTQDNLLVDLNTFDRVPLIREAISPQYEVRTQWNWAKPYGIKINVYPRDDNESRKQMSYLVPLPN